MQKKTCKECKIEKKLSDFHKHSGCLYGVRPICKECRIKQQIEYQKNNPKYKEYQKKHYKENKEYYKEQSKKNRPKKNNARNIRYAEDAEFRLATIKKSKEYRQRNPNKKKEHELRTKYNMTFEDFEKLKKDQSNSCAICGFKNDGNKAFFPFIDHCHSTNKVRGLLCSKCNFGIGHFNDDIDLLKKAIRYLEKTK